MKRTIAPLGNFDRTTTAAIGRDYGMEEMILTQRPSNGSIQEGIRLMSCIFDRKDPGDNSEVMAYHSSYPAILDLFLYNLQHGHAVTEVLNQFW